MARKSAEPLAEYVRKRDFSATPEPAGRKRSSTKTLRFVVQKHRATRLHYDFRLESGGVLASWAIPKGPSFDTHERRLAMKTEDHPWEYRTFEGVIPDGNYGAGEVIVWDEGTYTLSEGTDPVDEIAAGKIKFVLDGTKLHGEFTLVKIKHRDGESGEPWLMIKDRDQFVDPTYDPANQPESVKSGRTLDDIASAQNVKTWKSDRPAATKKKASVRAHAKAEPMPHDVSPMLASVVEKAFDNDEWLFELKWDGYRAIATIGAAGEVALTSRNGLDLLGQFGELSTLGAAFASRPVVVDGEICVIDANGKSSFQALQSRDKRARGSKTASPAAVTFVVFDVLYADGRDLRDRPLEERKALLADLLVEGHGAMLSKHIVGKGVDLYALAERSGLEGIVGKRRDSTYRSTRSKSWVKIKAQKRQEFAIGGWTEPRGSRDAFGALLVGVYDGDTFVYAGHVGTGFDAKTLREIGRELQAREIDASPFSVKPKTNTPAHWVRPELVAEVSFTEWTRDGVLRHPVFLGMRIDKDARAVVRETPA